MARLCQGNREAGKPVFLSCIPCVGMAPPSIQMPKQSLARHSHLLHALPIHIESITNLPWIRRLLHAHVLEHASSALASSGHHHLSPVPLLRPLCFVICWQAKVMALKPKSDHGHQNPPPIPWSSFCGSLLLLQALEHRFQCPW